MGLGHHLGSLQQPHVGAGQQGAGLPESCLAQWLLVAGAVSKLSGAWRVCRARWRTQALSAASADFLRGPRSRNVRKIFLRYLQNMVYFYVEKKLRRQRLLIKNSLKVLEV